MKICVFLHPFVNSYLNGTTINIYEFCQYLIDNKFTDVHMDYNNVNLDFDKRYSLLIPSINLQDVNEPFVLLTNSIRSFEHILIQDKLSLMQKIILIKPGGHKSQLESCIKKLGYSVSKKILNKLILLTNTNFSVEDRFNDIKTVVPYYHGVYNKYFKVSNVKIDYWLLHTSEHTKLNNTSLDMLKRVDGNELNKTLEYLNHMNVKVKLDSNESLTPYSYYKGMIYCKYVDYYPRMCCEFLLYDKPIWLFTYNDGLTYYLNIDSSIQLPKIITKEYLKPRSLWCDLDKLKELLQI